MSAAATSPVHLDPIAVSAAPLLRAIRAGQWTTRADLAVAAGRNPSNIARDLKILANAGLSDEPVDGEPGQSIVLTPSGVAQLAAIDRAEGQGGEPGSSAAEGSLSLVHAQILPDPTNDRRDWDSDEARDDLDSLRSDLIQNGLLQNLIVRAVAPDDLQGVSIEAVDSTTGVRRTLPLYRLVAGERRWRAIGEAITDGDWDVDRPILCRLLETDDLGHRLAALAENLQRRNLNPIEKARAFEGLAEAGLTNQQIADRISATPEHVQQHRRFLQLDEADQQRMTLAKDDPRHLSVRDARQKLAKKADDKVVAEDVPAEHILLIVELGHHARAEKGRWSAWVRVGPDFHADPRLEALQGTVWAYPRPENWGDDCGYFQAYVPTGQRTLIEAHAPWLDDEDAAVRDAGLLALHESQGVVPADGATYVTPSLNGPFAITPEGQAVLNERDAEAVRRREAETARLAENEARSLRWKQARERHALIFAIAHERAEAGRPDEAREVAENIDRPLPWAVGEKGTILDANGQTVTSFGHYHGVSDQGLVTAQMIVAAVNAAADLVTPEPPATEADEPEQDIDGNDPDADPEADDEDTFDDEQADAGAEAAA